MKPFYQLLIFLFISGSLAAQTPMELKSYLPKIEGWKINPEIEVFSPDNLFERINGAAPLFIENNFREMTSLEYTKGDEYITIQAYRHATPVDAFGMYSSERSDGLPFLPIGGEAQGDNMGLYFFAGSVYVKMQTNSESEDAGKTMQQIAGVFANKIDPAADYPELFKLFPKEGLQTHSESYTTTNYIGHNFLREVYFCNYEKDGILFQVFLIDAKSAENAKSIIDKYFEFTKQTGKPAEGKLLIKDKYNGDTPCIWKGQYIVGIFNESGSKLNGDALLEELAGKLK